MLLRQVLLRQVLLRQVLLRHVLLRRVLGWLESGVWFMGFSGSAAPCGAFAISPRPPGACQILDDGLTISYESPSVNTERAFRPRLVVIWAEVPDQSKRHLESFQSFTDRGVPSSLTASTNGTGGLRRSRPA